MSRQDVEQVAHPLPAGERVGDGEVGLDRVVVATSRSLPGDLAGAGDLTDDAVRGAFGDPDRFADVAQPGARILRDAQEHSGVVGEKRPGGHTVPRHKARLAFLDSQIRYSPSG
jgi:hypothetical protein